MPTILFSTLAVSVIAGVALMVVGGIAQSVVGGVLVVSSVVTALLYRLS